MYAQYDLGGMYYNGQGVAKNYAEAMKWFRKAADQGSANAQYGLGVMYDNDHAGLVRMLIARPVVGAVHEAPRRRS